MDEPETSAPTPTPPPVPMETSGLPRHLAAGVALLFPLVGGVAFLTIEKKDKFVRFHAMQSVYLGGLLLAVAIGLGVAEMIFRHVPFVGWLVALGFMVANLIFSLGWLGVWVVATVKAFCDKEWEVPFLGPLARKRLGEPAAGS